ncbi:putative tail-completion protein [Vibrio phage 142E35-1]|nr:putative tail-completion protein [Vibrio phage 142E35-1]
MSVYTDVIAMLNDTLSVPVFSDYVPETETSGAVALQEVSPDVATRILDGSKHGHTDVFRVTIVAASTTVVEGVIDELEALDNTQYGQFSKIYGQKILMEPKNAQQPVRRAWYDLTLKR